MLAQVVLTPAESKKLIAKAVAKLDVVKQAAADGMIVLHPSSSTYFIFEELTGVKPRQLLGLRCSYAAGNVCRDGDDGWRPFSPGR